MRQIRFYVPLPFEANQHYTMPGEVARHMSRVLRLAVDDEVILFNGDGYEYTVKITSASKKQVCVRVNCQSAISRESPLDVHLIQALSKGDKMETTIQKVVELGINRISPVTTNRSNVSLAGERLEKKMQHWQNIIHSACEQTGRNVIPQLSDLTSLNSVLDKEQNTPERLKIVFSPDAVEGLSQSSQSPKNITYLIGPEGGLSESETEYAMHCGFVKLKAGPRILRTETAGPAFLSMMQIMWGDFI